MIIAFEGIGGSGKTTQINMLANFLKSKGKTFIILKGGGTGGNTKELQNLKQKIDKSGDPKLTLLSKTIKLQINELEKAISKKFDYIILDRTYFTYLASAKSKGLELNEIFSSEMIENLKKFKPADKIFFLNIDPKNAHKFMKNKQTLSRGDLRATIEKDEAKNKPYLDIAQKNDWIIIDVENKDSIKDENSIHKEIISSIFSQT